jgi:hypothetical protein
LDDRSKYDPKLGKWYIAFSDVHEPRWWQKYLKPGFQHVRAFAFDERAAVWITFNPGWDGIVIRALKHPGEITDLLTKAYIAGPVLYCETEGGVVWKPRFIMDCSSQICHLLGLNLFVHTPWRLFCALKLRGASELIFKD